MAKHKKSTTVSFFVNDTATTEIYTLSLHDALPICAPRRACLRPGRGSASPACARRRSPPTRRSEEHTSELQSHLNLVCRLLLDKKTNKYYCQQLITPYIFVKDLQA